MRKLDHSNIQSANLVGGVAPTDSAAMIGGTIE